LVEASGLQRSYLSNLFAARIRPSRERAFYLEKAAKKAGKNIPAPLWIFGTAEELRAALLGEGSESACQ
jgi:hypothetical protein